MSVVRAARALTKREREILDLVAEGFTNAEIGKELLLGEETIKAHMRVILVKLDARNRAQAVAQGYRQGWL